MSELSCRLEEYLTLRRGLGFKLVGEGWLLASFVTFADPTVTLDRCGFGNGAIPRDNRRISGPAAPEMRKKTPALYSSMPAAM